MSGIRFLTVAALLGFTLLRFYVAHPQNHPEEPEGNWGTWQNVAEISLIRIDSLINW